MQEKSATYTKSGSQEEPQQKCYMKSDKKEIQFCSKQGKITACRHYCMTEWMKRITDNEPQWSPNRIAQNTPIYRVKNGVTWEHHNQTIPMQLKYNRPL